MPKLITTFVKPTDDAPWLLLHPDYSTTAFSQAERDNVLTPFRKYVATIPGINVASYQVSVTGNIAVASVEFDTVQHALDAIDLMGPNGTDAAVVAKNELLKSKAQALGFKYAIQQRIESDLPTV
jgi:hypothetical protein